MNLKTVKTDSEIVLEGIKVDVERQDGVVSAVLLHDKAGNSVAVRLGQYSQLCVLVQDKGESKP